MKTTKRVFIVLCCILASAITLTTQAATIASGTCGKNGDNLTWTLTDDGTLNISGIGEMQDYFSTSTPTPWYSYREEIKKVTISDKVTSIVSYAFAGCSGLTSVTIPNSVTSIGSSAFSGCSSLTSVYIPSSVTSIGGYAFQNCIGLKSVTMKSVTTIGGGAFAGCSGLVDVGIPNSVTTIEGDAFSGCSGLKSAFIPNSVKSIGYNAFKDVPNIVYSGTASGAAWGAKCMNGYVEGYIVYSDDTKANLVRCSTAARGDITIPNSVTTIGKDAFLDCTGLTSITMPNSVTYIGSSAFSYCI